MSPREAHEVSLPLEGGAVLAWPEPRREGWSLAVEARDLQRPLLTYERRQQGVILGQALDRDVQSPLRWPESGAPGVTKAAYVEWVLRDVDSFETIDLSQCPRTLPCPTKTVSIDRPVAVLHALFTPPEAPRLAWSAVTRLPLSETTLSAWPSLLPEQGWRVRLASHPEVALTPCEGEAPRDPSFLAAAPLGPGAGGTWALRAGAAVVSVQVAPDAPGLPPKVTLSPLATCPEVRP